MQEHFTHTTNTSTHTYMCDNNKKKTTKSKIYKIDL